MKKMLLILILQAALVESLREVTGYPGDTVILHSGADPSWKLSSIEWSIFSNNTWIATHHSNKTNIKRVNRYNGRLDLNIASGDLTIKNLATEDDMEYTVHLINTERQNSVDKTRLIVKQRLQKPTLDKTYESNEGGCRLWLLCSSTDEGVDLSWQGEATGVTVFNMYNGKPAILVAFLKTTQDSANFTCTSSSNTEKASTNVTLKCYDDKPQPSNPDPEHRARGRNGLYCAFSLLFLLLTFTICFYIGVQHMNERN